MSQTPPRDPGEPGDGPAADDDPGNPDESGTSGDRLDADDGGLTRLDPDAVHGPPELEQPPPPAPAIDTRRYGWMIGLFGLALVVAVSIYQFATHGVGTTGIAPGHRLRFFAAPLANTTLVGDPNLHPPCTVARHDPRALNVCLLAARGPLVLSFFVTASSECVHQVDALQALSRRYRDVQFAAVAVHGSRTSVARLVRSHGWTIPVAYDRDGSVGSVYGVAVCPMAELAARGGIVRDRLIGDPWETARELEPRVRALAAAAHAGAG